MIDDKLIKKLKKYIKDNYQLTGELTEQVIPESKTRKKPFEKLVQPMHRLTGSTFKDVTDTLIRFIKKERQSETFSAMLERLRKEKEMTAAQLYNGAWIKKQLYSKIMGERNYHPSKNTVLAFGMALRLDRDGMDGLLESAGYMLSNSSIADLVILFCIDQGLHDLHDVNALLLSADQKVLCRE